MRESSTTDSLPPDRHPERLFSYGIAPGILQTHCGRPDGPLLIKSFRFLMDRCREPSSEGATGWVDTLRVWAGKGTPGFWTAPSMNTGAGCLCADVSQHRATRCREGSCIAARWTVVGHRRLMLACVVVARTPVSLPTSFTMGSKSLLIKPSGFPVASGFQPVSKSEWEPVIEIFQSIIS